MKLKPAHKKLEVVPAIEALARTLLTTLDLVAAAGEERDDRPRQLAVTVARWARDEATAAELGVATRAITVPRAEVSAGSEAGESPEADPRKSPWVRALSAAYALGEARGVVMHYPTHERYRVRECLDTFAEVLAALGEARDAAWARTDGTYVQHFTAITGHAPRPISLTRWGEPAGPLPER